MKQIARLTGIAALGFLFFIQAQPSFAATNPLTNPGAESGGTGWTTIANGGNGMSYSFDTFVHSGAQSFQTSFGLDSVSQRVDLLAHGYSANDLDSAPSITFNIWVGTRADQAGQYYVKFSLLQQDGSTVVTTTNFGTSSALVPLAANTSWFPVDYTFSNYGSGVRYAYIEFGGQDQSGWAGNYGTHFDDASINVAEVLHGGGGSTMPWWGYVPPKGPFSVTMHGAGSIATTTDVVLDLSASTDVDRMALSRREDFYGSGIVPFSTSIPWSVCGAAICDPGTYDVYVKFYQAYGLSSPAQHLVITYKSPENILVNETIKTVSSPSASSTTSVRIEDNHPVLFARNLRLGDRGHDVKRLQVFLNQHGFMLARAGHGSVGNETDVFGPMLKQALLRFQEANMEKLLTPLGLKKGTGAFGFRTLELVNSLVRDEAAHDAKRES